MSGNDGSSDIQRHFLMPNEFVGGPSGVLVIVTSQGGVVSAIKGELGIVRGSLAWSCSISKSTEEDTFSSGPF